MSIQGQLKVVLYLFTQKKVKQVIQAGNTYFIKPRISQRGVQKITFNTDFLNIENQIVKNVDNEEFSQQIQFAQNGQNGQKIPQNGELLQLFTFSVQYEDEGENFETFTLPIQQTQKFQNFIKIQANQGKICEDVQNAQNSENSENSFKIKFFMYEEFLEEVEIRQGQKPMIISTDIGGTLVGNLEFLKKFQHAYLKHYYFDKKSKLIYNSGRSFESYEKSQGLNNLIKPDYFISRCGVIIYENKNQGQFEEIKEWTDQIIIDWNYQLIEKKVQQIKWLIQKVNQNDRNLCIKYLCSNEEFEKHAEEFYKVEKELHESNLNFECIVRTKKDKKSIDFIPVSTNKGQALQFICSQKIHVGLQQVFAFGDTMNDCAMLEMAGKGILVKNSMDDVVQWMDELNQAKQIYSKQLILSNEKIKNKSNSSENSPQLDQNDVISIPYKENSNDENVNSKNIIKIDSEFQKQLCKCQIERQGLLQRFVQNNYKNVKSKKCLQVNQNTENSIQSNSNQNNINNNLCMCPEEEQFLNNQLKKSPEYIINQNNIVQLSDHEYAGALLDVIEQQISNDVQ